MGGHPLTSTLLLYHHHWLSQVITTGAPVASTRGAGLLLLLPDQSFHLPHEAQAELILPWQGDALHRYGQTLTSRNSLNTKEQTG